MPAACRARSVGEEAVAVLQRGGEVDLLELVLMKLLRQMMMMMMMMVMVVVQVQRLLIQRLLVTQHCHCTKCASCYCNMKEAGRP
jgi:hypothetical protein